MKILLTGGTGHIGSAVLRTLVAADHDVVALVRSDASAAKVAEAGATALRGDITDVAWLTEQLSLVDGAVHTASPGDATSRDVDHAIATAAAAAYAGTDKPYVHTGGVWVYGSGGDLTEESPFAPPALTAWRESVERVVLDADGMRATVVVPGVVYGYGAGIPNALTGAPTDDAGNLLLIGDGTQHWSTVHTDDLADLYLRVLEGGRHGAYYLGVADAPTVRELGEAAAEAAGAPGVTPDTVEGAHARFGEPFGDALLLDQRATAARSTSELGWAPLQPSLVEELRSGAYSHATA